MATQLLATVLAKNRLSKMVEKARFLKLLNDLLLPQLLSEDMLKHCRVMNVKDQTLIIGVSSAAWATRLRYQTREMIQKIGRLSAVYHHKHSLPIALVGDYAIRKIRLKVRPF